MVYNILNEKIKKTEQIKNELIKKGVKNLNQKLKNDDYKIDNIIEKHSVSDTYNNLINSKDKIDSRFQSNYNKTYHSVDVELYKLNRKIDNKIRLVNKDYETKKEKIELKLKKNLL